MPNLVTLGGIEMERVRINFVLGIFLNWPQQLRQLIVRLRVLNVWKEIFCSAIFRQWQRRWEGAGKPYWKGRISTVDLLLLTSSDRLLTILNLYFSIFYRTTFLNKEVNRTEPSPSVRVSWMVLRHWVSLPFCKLLKK